MSDQTNGLRFDVYERVHLPEDVAAIDVLEEIELVPRIQVIDQGDHAMLRGQLLLSGVYRSQNNPETSLTLEHWIPVEITLPMNRISRLDDISIEIDNFDVDLLSARTLNITGVLSLRGISAQPVLEQEDIWREEPFTVVHQRETFDEHSSENFGSQNATDEQQYISDEMGIGRQEDSAYQQELTLPDESDIATVTISSAPSNTGWSSSQLFNNALPQIEAEREISLASQQTSNEGWLSTSSPFANQALEESTNEEISQSFEQDQDQDQDQDQAEDREEQERNDPPIASFAEAESNQRPEQEQGNKEPRLSITNNQSGQGADLAGDVGILTLLQTSRREQAARQAAEQVVAQQRADEEARVQASGDEIEWKNLFLGKRIEDTEFSKIRMCIVQRDETLDLIASRYSLNPREIVMYNRLDNSSISEGQLLYIP